VYLEKRSFLNLAASEPPTTTVIMIPYSGNAAENCRPINLAPFEFRDKYWSQVVAAISRATASKQVRNEGDLGQTRGNPNFLFWQG
jgi:hypothetical protein